MRAKVLQFPFAPAYTQRLHCYLMRRMRNPDDIDDVIQEAYLRYLRMPSSHAVTDPEKYVAIIADNLVKELGRKQSSALVRFDSQAVEFSQVASHEPDPARQLIAKEELERALLSIPETYRRVLMLSKVEGLDHRAIAKRLDLTPNSVLKYLVRATTAARKAAAK